MREVWAGLIAAVFLLLPATGAYSADQPELVPGYSSLDGDYRVRSFAWPGSPLARSDRAVTRSFTPRYPDSERSARRDYRNRVIIQLDSTGTVVGSRVVGWHETPNPYAAFDSASARTARLWTWEPGASVERPQTLEFIYRGRPVAPQGEGSTTLIAIESVSGDTLEAGGLGMSGPAREAGSLSFGRTWTRLDDLPAGETQMIASYSSLGSANAHWTVRPNIVDTITVVVTPQRGTPPGHTFWTHPPAASPRRPEDERIYPLSAFTFRLETDDGEVVDAGRGIVTKDMVVDQDITTTLILTPAELDQIRRKLIEIHFFEMADPVPSLTRSTTPDTKFIFEATAGGRTKRLSWKWSTGIEDHNYPSDDWKRRRDLINLIREIVAARPEWKALPPTRGLYR